MINGEDAFLLEGIFRNEIWGFVAEPISKTNEAAVNNALASRCVTESTYAESFTERSYAELSKKNVMPDSAQHLEPNYMSCNPIFWLVLPTFSTFKHCLFFSYYLGFHSLCYALYICNWSLGPYLTILKVNCVCMTQPKLIGRLPGIKNVNGSMYQEYQAPPSRPMRVLFRLPCLLQKV